MLESTYFDTGIERLKKRHGATSYPFEYKRLIWSCVRNMSSQQFDFMVDSVIGEYRHEPPLSKIKEMASLARHSIQKDAQTFNHSSEPFPNSIFDKEETDLFFKTLKGICAGTVGKDKKDQMIEYIETRLRGVGIKFETVLTKGD